MEVSARPWSVQPANGVVIPRIAAGWQQRAGEPPLRSHDMKKAAEAAVLRLAESGLRVEPFWRDVMVILNPVLVTADLAVELVDQLIDRGIEIFAGVLDEDVLALDMQRDLGLLTSFLLTELLDGQQHVDVDDLVEVARDAIHLREHIFPQGGRDVEVMTADRQIHEVPFAGVEGAG